MAKIAIIGAGGLGKEVLSMLRYGMQRQGIKGEIWGFLDDALPIGTVVGGVPVKGKIREAMDLLPEHAQIYMAIADPQIKKTLVAALDGPYFTFPNLIFPGVVVYDPDTVKYGKGVIIGAGVVLTTAIAIADFVFININSVVGHDVSIQPYVSIMPGVRLSGNVVVGEATYLGTSATVLPGVAIGENTVVGASSVVNHALPSNCTAVGAPARIIKSNVND